MRLNRRLIVWVLLIHVLAGLLFLAPGYLVPDSVAVYSFLRSIVFNQDLLFYDEWAGFAMMENGATLYKEVTPVGAVANHWWIGTSVMVAPYYLLAHPLALPLDDTNGFTGLYAFVLAWASVVFGALACAVAMTLLPDELDTVAAVAILVAVWIGTPVFWYEYRFPLGTHLAGVLAVAILVFLLDKAQTISSDRLAVAIGLLLGMTIIVRLQHAMLGPAVAWILFRSQHFRFQSIAFAAFLLPLSIQASAWQAIYGHPLGPLVRGASPGGATWMPFEQNAIDEVLFSSYHGLFTWAPVTILGVAGLVLWARRSILGQGLLLMFVGELVANGLFDRYFWGGLSFGPRRFVDLVVPLAMGIGVLMLRQRKIVMILMAVATAWGVLLAAAAMAGTLDLTHDVAPSELVVSAFSVPWQAMGERILASAGSLRDPMLAGGSLLLVLVLTAAMFWTVRRTGRPVMVLSAYLLCWTVVVISTIPVTRSRSAAAIDRFGISRVVAAELGPLLDAQGLISDELQFLRRTGRLERAAEVERELDLIAARIAALRSRYPEPEPDLPVLDGPPTAGQSEKR